MKGARRAAETTATRPSGPQEQHERVAVRRRSGRRQHGSGGLLLVLLRVVRYSCVVIVVDSSFLRMLLSQQVANSIGPSFVSTQLQTPDYQERGD